MTTNRMQTRTVLIVVVGIFAFFAILIHGAISILNNADLENLRGNAQEELGITEYGTKMPYTYVVDCATGAVQTYEMTLTIERVADPDACSKVASTITTLDGVHTADGTIIVSNSPLSEDEVLARA